MYNYFNKTLWERINHQDESFWKDVKELKYLVNSVKEECLQPNDDSVDAKNGGKSYALLYAMYFIVPDETVAIAIN